LASFNGANLSETEILRSSHSSLRCREANLENAVLGSNNKRAPKALDGNFRGANLRGVQFVNCTIRTVDMSGADLRGSNFANVLSDHSYIWFDDPQQGPNRNSSGYMVFLNGANLSGMTFRAGLDGLQLVGANLQGCKLGGSLKKTNLTGANLSGADLTHAVFDETNLSKADLSGVNLDELDLGGAIFNAPAPAMKPRKDRKDPTGEKWDDATGLRWAKSFNVQAKDLHWSVPFGERIMLPPSEGGAATGRGEKDPNSKSPTHSPKNVPCPKCDGHLEERSGRFGPFLGCTAYPKCRFTSSVKAKPAVSVEEDMVRWLRTQRDNSFARDLVKWFEEKGFLSKKQLAAAAKLRRDQVTQRHEADNGYEGRNETDDYYDYLREIAEDNGQSFGDFMDSVWRD